MIKTDINGRVHWKYRVLNIVTTSGLLNSILPLRVDLGASWNLLQKYDRNTTDLGPRSLLFTAKGCKTLNCEIHLLHLTSPRNLLQGMLKIIWQSLQSWQEVVKAHSPTKPTSTKDVKHVTVFSESKSPLVSFVSVPTKVDTEAAKHLVCGSSFGHLAKCKKWFRAIGFARDLDGLGTACTLKI